MTFHCYRATLCVSPVLAVGRCPSVRPSVAVMYCIQMVTDIVKLFFSTDSPIVIVFLLLSPIPNSKKNTSEGVEHTGCGRFAIFDWNRRLSREWYEMDPRSLWNVNKKSRVVYNGDLERRDAGCQLFQTDRLNNARTVWPRTTKFGKEIITGYNYSCGDSYINYCLAYSFSFERKESSQWWSTMNYLLFYYLFITPWGSTKTHYTRKEIYTNKSYKKL